MKGCDSMIKCKLKVLLAMNEMTQKQLADKTGVRLPTISNMANSSVKHYPVDVLEKICKELNCNVGDLIEYIDEE